VVPATAPGGLKAIPIRPTPEARSAELDPAMSVTHLWLGWALEVGRG